MQAEGSYLSWEAIEKSWVEKCSAKMQFIDRGASLRVEKAAVENRNGKLEALLEKLLERLT